MWTHLDTLLHEDVTDLGLPLEKNPTQQSRGGYINENVQEEVVNTITQHQLKGHGRSREEGTWNIKSQLHGEVLSKLHK